MKIVHLSTHDERGGAARAAARLHMGLLDLGVESKLEVAVKTGSMPNTRQTPLDPTITAKIQRGWLRRRKRKDWAGYKLFPGNERMSDDRAELGVRLPARLPDADIYHLHWVADFVDHRDFFPQIAAEIPIVWTLHDMNPFTGGCHYSGGCTRYRQECGACPQLGSADPRDLSHQIWRRKGIALRSRGDSSLHVVGDSLWTTARARESSLLGRFPSSTVYYGLDTTIFRPIDRTEVRAALGLDPDARVLLFVADSVVNQRKGFRHLVEAISTLSDLEGLQILSIGEGHFQLPPGIRIRSLGRVDGDEKLAQVYGAADLFVMPSLEEAFGQTVIEAAACGTPSVGFPVGGIPEAIRDGATGLVTEGVGSDALAQSIRELLCDRDRLLQMRIRCREVVERDHTLKTQARMYADLYRQLLDRPAR